VTYFFDNNISYKLVTIPKALDVDALHLIDEFPANMPDVDWLPRAGQAGWVVITADRAIRRRPGELSALKDAGVLALFLRDNFLRRDKWEQALWLVRHWPEIDKQVARLKHGTIASVSDRGKLEVLR
jgi:hypothetical protein